MDKVTRQCPQTTTFLKRRESRSGIEPRSFRLPAYRLTARPDRLSDRCFVVDRFYSAVLRFQADSLRSCCIRFLMSDSLFIARFEYPPMLCAYNVVWLLHGWCHVKLLPYRHVLCTSYSHAPCHVIACKATCVECMRVLDATNHCTFGRMTGIILLLLR